MSGQSSTPDLAARSRTVLLVLAATICGLWLRVSLAFASGLWRDEVQSLEISRLATVRDVVTFLAREDSHPPLFYFFERAWVGVFGQSDVALVALGLLPGTALIPAAAWVAGRYGGLVAAALGAWLPAIAWPLVWHSGDARPYAFLSFASVIAAWAGLEAVRLPSKRTWARYVTGSVVIFYVHSWWVLVLVSQALVTLYYTARLPGRRWRDIRRWAVAHTIIAVICTPWIPVLLHQARSAGYAAYARFPIEWPFVATTLLLAVTLTLALPALLLLGIGRERPSLDAAGPSAAAYFATIAILTCVLAVAVWPVSNLAVSHCVAAIASLSLIAVAILLGRPGAPTGLARRMVCAGLFLALLAMAMGSRWYLKSNVREAARLVALEAKAGDLVLVYPSSIGPVFRRYHRSAARVLAVPEQGGPSPTAFGRWWVRFGDRHAFESAFEAIRAAKRAGGTVWTVVQWRRSSVADSLAPVGSDERFQHEIGARLGELRERLDSTIGRGEPVLNSREGRWRRELVDVDRFVAARR